MFRKLLFALFTLLSIATSSAYDFKYERLYYNIISEEDRTVEVTYKDLNNDLDYVSGDIEIPRKVMYKSKTYTVTSIGSSAFFGCSSLSSVTIGNSVTSIGDYAFRSCSSLTSVTIGYSVSSIGSAAFAYCSKLETIYVDPANIEFSFIDGILYNKDASTLLCCLAGKTTMTIPNSVTSIENGAFAGCFSLTSVAIPNSVTSIGESAFSGCSSLTSVAIPNSVTSIGESAFFGCSSLTSAAIPNSVTSIGKNAFWLCSRLTSVTIGNSVTSIGYGMFNGCSSLSSVSIGNSVTSIGMDAFGGCSSLTSVTIPNSVTSIGTCAFGGCSRLETIYVQCKIPIRCNPDFSDGVLKNAILYVPTGTMAAYEKVDPWRNFWNVEEMDYSGVTTVTTDNSSQVQLSVESGILTISGLDTGTHITIHDMQGRMVYSGTSHTISHLTPGLYILRTPSLTTKFSL